MKLDISAAPEIAQAAAACQAGAPVQGAPATIGQLAARLRLLLADPQSWWDLVRFDPHRPARITVCTPGPGWQAWLCVLPPGHREDAWHPEQGWEVGCLVAGAMAEQAGTPGAWRSHALRPGRMRVRGGAGPYRMVNTGDGYAVSLHARSPGLAHPG